MCADLNVGKHSWCCCCLLPAFALHFNRITLRTHPHIHTRKVSSSVHTHLKHLKALKLRQQPYYSVMIARSTRPRSCVSVCVWKSYGDCMHICVCSFICATQMVKCFVDYGERTRSVIELGKQTLNKASVRCAYSYASVCVVCVCVLQTYRHVDISVFILICIKGGSHSGQSAGIAIAPRWQAKTKWNFV